MTRNIEDKELESGRDYEVRISEIHSRLVDMAEESYQKFSSNLLPGVKNILGVRLPKLRVIAKEITRQDWVQFLEVASDDSFEEIMLQGMVIGYVKEPLEMLIPYIQKFVPKIDNWSVCDSFCSGLKIATREPFVMWDFIQLYLASKNEFDVRFAVVMILNYYVNDTYIDRVFTIFQKIKHDGYYARMAIAWAISIYYINFPTRTYEFLKDSKLDTFTHNKAIQKICESRVITKKDKVNVKSIRIE